MLYSQGVFEPHTAKMLGGEVRDAGELKRLFLRESIADFDCSMIMNADDITGISFFDIGAVLRQKNRLPRALPLWLLWDVRQVAERFSQKRREVPSHRNYL